MTGHRTFTQPKSLGWLCIWLVYWASLSFSLAPQAQAIASGQEASRSAPKACAPQPLLTHQSLLECDSEEENEFSSGSQQTTTYRFVYHQASHQISSRDQILHSYKQPITTSPRGPPSTSL